MNLLQSLLFILHELCGNLAVVIALAYCLTSRRSGLRGWLSLALLTQLASIAYSVPSWFWHIAHNRMWVSDPAIRIRDISHVIGPIFRAASWAFVGLAVFEVWCSTRFRTSSWTQAFSWRGRASRAQWWGLTMMLQGLTFVTSGSLETAFSPMSKEYVKGNIWSLDLQTGGWIRVFYSILIVVVFGLLLWVTVAAYVKRWHDRGKSGWMCLLILLPIVGPIWTLVELGFLPGSTAPNRWGENEILEPAAAAKSTG